MCKIVSSFPPFALFLCFFWFYIDFFYYQTNVWFLYFFFSLLYRSGRREIFRSNFSKSCTSQKLYYIMFLVIEKEEERTPCTCWKNHGARRTITNTKRDTEHEHGRTERSTWDTPPPRHHERRSTAEKIRHGAETIHGAELWAEQVRSIKRAETLKSGRRAVLNATIKIVGRCLNASCYFVGRFFNQYKCDFKKRAEILKKCFKSCIW